MGGRLVGSLGKGIFAKYKKGAIFRCLGAHPVVKERKRREERREKREERRGKRERKRKEEKGRGRERRREEERRGKREERREEREERRGRGRRKKEEGSLLVLLLFHVVALCPGPSPFSFLHFARPCRHLIALLFSPPSFFPYISSPAVLPCAFFELLCFPPRMLHHPTMPPP